MSPTRPGLVLLGLLACTCMGLAQDAPKEMPERSGVVSRGFVPYTLLGPALKVGKGVPAVTLRNAKLDRESLNFKDGKVRLVVVLPSLDTPVCQLEAHEFNERAAGLGKGVEVLVISRDLPFAQKRYCAAEGIERLRVLSDFESGAFGKNWGLYVKETGLLCRAVLVVDGKGILRYQQIVADLGKQPNYEDPIAAASQLVKGE